MLRDALLVLVLLGLLAGAFLLAYGATKVGEELTREREGQERARAKKRDIEYHK